METWDVEMAMNQVYDLYISYHRNDCVSVDALVKALRGEGLNIYIDHFEVEGVAPIQSSIERGLSQAKALLAWYSMDYPQSRACQWELTAGLIASEAETAPVKRLLVISPEPSLAPFQPQQLRDLLYLCFDGDYTELARQIAEAIRPIEGTLGALRQQRKPHWHGNYHGFGSNRFVGRYSELWDIHSSLSANLSPQRQARELVQVRGGSGVGKSLLVTEYALRFGSRWSGGIFWLNGLGSSDNKEETEAALSIRRQLAYSSQLAEIAWRMGLKLCDKSDQELRTDIGRLLTEPYLWIVDDLPACDPRELERWLAPSGRGQTLITTRSAALDGIGKSIDLTELAFDEARTLLTFGNPPRAEENTDIDTILEYMDGHALTLDVARTVCQRHGYARFRQKLDTPCVESLGLAVQLEGDLPTGYNPYVAATLLTSIQQLDERGRDALRLATKLAADPIPVDLLTDCLASADGLVPENAENRAVLGLHQILCQSLAEETSDSTAYRVHSLVCRTMQYHDINFDRQGQLREAAMTVLAERMMVAADMSKHRSLALHLPHVQLLAGEADNCDSLNLAGWLGWYEWEPGRYQAAEFWWDIEYRGCLHLLGETHPATLNSMNNLAETLRHQGDFSGARSLQEKVLETRRLLLGVGHPATQTSMNNLSETFRDQGDLASACALQEEALTVSRRVLGEEHPNTLTSMANLAGTLWNQGDLARARALEEQTLAVRIRVLGEEHPDTSISAWNLFRTLDQLGEFDQAQALLRDHLLWMLQRNPINMGAQQRQIREGLLEIVTSPASRPQRTETALVSVIKDQGNALTIR